MKSTLLKLIAIAAFAATPAFAHQGIKIGSNGGRIFKLKSKTTPQLEVAAKDGKFVVYVLDESGKSLPLGDRTLAITAGERSKPEKLSVEKSGETFTAMIPKGKEFPVVFQIREKEGDKPLTARMNYDSASCPECKEPEWLCACGAEEKQK